MCPKINFSTFFLVFVRMVGNLLENAILQNPPTFLSNLVSIHFPFPSEGFPKKRNSNKIHNFLTYRFFIPPSGRGMGRRGAGNPRFPALEILLENAILQNPLSFLSNLVAIHFPFPLEGFPKREILTNFPPF